MIQAPGVELAPLETERFGIVVARSPLLTSANLDEVLRFCRDHRVSMLIARVPATDLITVQALEREGFRLMDTLVRYEIALKAAPAPPISSAIRPLKPGEDEAVVSVAQAAFAGYFGHYHADPGEAGFYGDRDPNCCPSQVLSVELALRGDSMVLFNHSVAASPVR